MSDNDEIVVTHDLVQREKVRSVARADMLDYISRNPGAPTRDVCRCSGSCLALTMKGAKAALYVLLKRKSVIKRTLNKRNFWYIANTQDGE